MLRRLAVKNLAIVEDLEMELEPGLTVITGETGAGKSILVDALSLLAGGRGSVELVRQGAERLSVSGEFEPDASVRRVLSEAGLPVGETLLLRREFSPDGKGRVFVEDEPASVRTLAKIGDRLVTIHGQNSERDLVDPEAPLELLDAFARLEKEAAGDGGSGAGLERDPGSSRSAASVAEGPGSEARNDRIPDPRDRRGRARREGGGGAAARARETPPRGPRPARGRDGALGALRRGGVGGRPAGRSGQGLRGARGDRSAGEGPSRGGGGRQAPHRGPRRGGPRRGGSRSRATRSG